MEENGTIDEIDIQILNILQENARTSNAEIARRVSMAPSAVLERIRKMERSGLIKGYGARIDPKAAGLSLTAFTFVHAEHSVGREAGELGSRLAALDEVLEVHYTAGAAAYLLKIRVADTDALAGVLQRIGNIDGVRDTNSTIVLSTVLESARLPLA